MRDDQWERIRAHFPEEPIPENRPGRTPIPTRAVLEAVLWILNTGAQWHRLPQCYPHYKTVQRRLLVPWEYYATTFLGFVQLASSDLQ